MHAGFKHVNKQLADLKKVVLTLVSRLSVNEQQVNATVLSQRCVIICISSVHYLPVDVCVDLIGIFKDKGRPRVRIFLYVLSYYFVPNHNPGPFVDENYHRSS